ncbi:SMP-30/gluconolactonase/LRE family protein [Actinomadura sediminis]|uniref:WD40 repeat domain-containing protein n=1 Tax=Actinomadura sediminis TaxID=1038904 RepID=A0ABW3EGK2_9ACTN
MRDTPMDGRHGKHEGPARGSWAREAWRGLVPIAVATGAVLVIGGGFDVLERHHGAAKSRSAKAAADAGPAAPGLVAGVVADGSALVVRDTGTGADTGLPIAPPPGRRFTRVASGPDGSFVVASAGGGRVTFHRLNLDDDGRAEALVPLPEAVVPGESAEWSDLAVASDGRIAYVTYEGKRGTIAVVEPGTGARKSWPAASQGRVGGLSWSGDALSFVWTAAGKTQVRTIDTAASAGDLKSSETVATLPSGTAAAFLRPDGTTIVTGRVQDANLVLQAYSPTGEPGQILWKHPIKGAPTVRALDPAENGALLALAGDLYGPAGPLPGKDLADAAW